jgi:hypothetical protein
MKLKFPEGVSQYIDAEGLAHIPDELGHFVTSHAQKIKDAMRAGFAEVVEKVEEVLNTDLNGDGVAGEQTGDNSSAEQTDPAA